MPSSASDISQQLHALASPETAVNLQRFFKTGAGQYGEGDVFLGIKVPQLRALAKQHHHTTLPTIAPLLNSQYHEQRLLALLLLMQFYDRATKEGRAAAFDLYLENTRRINNWDLVDVSAPHIVGRHLQDRPRDILFELARSPILWERRIAIIATLYFIRNNDFSDTLSLSALLLQDKHDLMHKAVGWMLREVGKRDLETEENFLQHHYHFMPRTMLRYAIERLPEQKRLQYLRGTA